MGIKKKKEENEKMLHTLMGQPPSNFQEGSGLGVDTQGIPPSSYLEVCFQFPLDHVRVLPV